MKLFQTVSKEKYLHFLHWSLIYVVTAVLSLFVTNYEYGAPYNNLVWMLCLFIPRLMSLALFLIPCQLIPYRYTGTGVMLAAWFAWFGVTQSCFTMMLLPVSACLFFAVLYFLLKERKKSAISNYKELFSKITILMMLSVLIVFGMEFIQTQSFLVPFETMIGNPDVLACNLLYFTALGSFVFWCPKAKSAAVVYLVLWFGLSFGSLYKSLNLYEPLLPNDVFNAKDGIPTAIKFLGVLGTVLVAIGIVCVIVGIVLIVKLEKSKKFNKYAFGACVVYVLIALSGAVVASRVPGTDFNYDIKAQETFNQRGFVYSFMSYSVDALFPEQGFNEETVDQVLDNLSKQTPPSATTEIKNLIVIQLESFMDPYQIEGAVYERDPMPFLRSLQDEYTSGTIRVPTYGGTTVRSEFEFLTGMNLTLLEPQGGKSFNPYTKYLYNQSVDSLARALKEQGFKTTALHNYQGEFFYRNDVYKNLGFDCFIPYELMSGVEKRNGKIWANDSIFVSQYENIFANTSSEKNFIFNVTVQLHGNYPSIDQKNYCMDIQGIEDESLCGQVAYYVNELEAVDKAIEGIVSYFGERNEPTYILFYSDHLPKFARYTNGFDASDRYVVSYFSWNNMNLLEEDEDLDLYRLSTKLLNTVGLQGNVMNQFHNVYGSSEHYRELLSELQVYKFFHEYSNPAYAAYYSNDNYTIGAGSLQIESIQWDDSEGAYVVKGSGFTENVWFCINDVRLKDKDDGYLEYVDARTMILRNYKGSLSSKDRIVLQVVGEKYGEVLKTSSVFALSD
ncbi:MAG: LTA synthase family protein [Clostridia bacterium]|nr:LTA synthase family protein [Clostridia bacterium]